MQSMKWGMTACGRSGGGVMRFAVAALIAVALSGCVQMPKQAFNRDAHLDLTTIGVIEPPVIEEYSVVNLGHPGMGFGLVGVLIAAGDIRSKTIEFSKMAQASRLDVRTECRDAMSKELILAGYKIKLVQAKRDEGKFLESYDALDSSVDAYLDVVCSAGYAAAGPVSPYVPAVMFNVRMVKRVTREIVYQDILSYGYEHRHSQAVNTAADAEYRFSDFSSLMKDDKKAVDGLRKGIPILARRLAQDVGRASVVVTAAPLARAAAAPDVSATQAGDSTAVGGAARPAQAAMPAGAPK